MADIDLTSALLAEIRQRYSKKPAPLCTCCGDPMEFICIHSNLPMYACKGFEIINGERVNKPGRSGIRDCHFMQSREWINDKYDKDVLALVDYVEHMHNEVLALADHVLTTFKGDAGE